MLIFLASLLATLPSILRSRAALELENLALRHQIGVLQRSARKRPKLILLDRLLWAALSRVWSDWRSALAIVQPETVFAWHRRGFRLFWAWKIRRGQPGRPTLPREVRDLIRRMCRENPTWGAPRIHGELLKLGINVGKAASANTWSAAASDLAYLSGQSCQAVGLHRFLHLPGSPKSSIKQTLFRFLWNSRVPIFVPVYLRLTLRSVMVVFLRITLAR
jgi:hypothetical protein